MRFREIRGGLQMPVSIEEQALIDFIEEQEGQFIDGDSLNERQGEVARKMVSRGVLERTQQDETLYFVVSKLDDLWR